MATQYQHDHPDNRKTSGVVSSTVKENGVAEGSHTVKIFPNLIHAEWSKQEADLKDTVQMKVRGLYFPDGEQVEFEVFEVDGSEKSITKEPLPATMSNNTAQVSWKYPVDKDGNIRKGSSQPEFFFKCTPKNSSGTPVKSARLKITGTISISLVDEYGEPVKIEPAMIKTSYRQLIDATTDNVGVITLKRIPIGFHRIKFTKDPLIDLNAEQTVESIREFPPFFPLSFSSQNKFYGNSYYLACSHEVKESKYKRTVKRPTFFEVVPSWEENGADKVSIFADPRREVKDPNGKPLESVGKEGGLAKSVFECAYSPGDGKANFFEKTFWHSFTKPNEYKITVGKQQVTLRAFCPDTYGIKISLPALRKMSGGVKLGKEADLKDQSGNTITPAPSKPPIEGKTNGWGSLHMKREKPDNKVPIELSRNGNALEISSIKVLGGILKTIGEVENIIEQIKEAVPKAGIYFDLEIGVLQGSLAATFCWKEYKDHRAYFCIAANIDIVLFSIGMEIGVGVSGFACALQIFGKVEGKVTLSYKGERISPDGDKELQIPIGAGVSIEGSLGIRLQVIYMATATGAIKTAIELQNGCLKINSEEGVSVSCGLKWTGIKGSISVSASAGKKGGEGEGDDDDDGEIKQDQDKNKVAEGSWEKEWVEGKDLGTLQFPSLEEYTPPIIQREDVKRIIGEVFDKKGKIKIFVSFGRVYPNLIDDLEEAINRNDKIRRTQRNIQALAYEIHKALWKISTKDIMQKDRIVDMRDYMTFRDSEGLDAILKQNGDSAHELANSLSKSEKE